MDGKDRNAVKRLWCGVGGRGVRTAESVIGNLHFLKSTIAALRPPWCLLAGESEPSRNPAFRASAGSDSTADIYKGGIWSWTNPSELPQGFPGMPSS